MRAYIWIAVVAVAAAWTTSASAQTTYNIIQPSAYQNTTTSRNNLPVGGSASTANSFKLTGLFYRGAHMPNKPTGGSSTFPTPATMNALTPAYMSYFGVQRPTTGVANQSPWSSFLSAFSVFGK
jgi:hypothetical protein